LPAPLPAGLVWLECAKPYGETKVMSLVSVALVVALLFCLAYGVIIYNALVRLKHGIGKAWSNIDVLLKQRHDELPKLVETCKQYMQHERSTLEQVISARNAVSSAREKHDVGALGKAESGLRAGLGQLFALAENYPELKANESFQFLQQRISGLENGIADRRELYNEAVNLNNVRIEQFPDVLLARHFGFKAAELLQFSEAEKADVNIKQLFG
jgi:LemA protein